MSGLDLVPFRRLIDDTVDVARPHFRRIFPAIAIPVGLIGAIVALVQHRAMRSMLDTSENLFIQFAQFGVLIVLIFGAFLWAFVALFVASLDAVAGREIDLGRAWRFALRPSVFVTLVLTFIAQILSLLLCFLPALVVWPMLSLVIPVMVEEGKVGFAAMGRSISIARWNGTGKLSDSSFLQLGVMLFVGWLVQNALGVLIQGPVALIQNYLIFREGVGGAIDPTMAIGPLWLQLPAQLANASLGAAAWFYWTFGFSLLYHELRRRREAADLRQEVTALTASTVGS